MKRLGPSLSCAASLALAAAPPGSAAVIGPVARVAAAQPRSILGNLSAPVASMPAAIPSGPLSAGLPVSSVPLVPVSAASARILIGQPGDESPGSLDAAKQSADEAFSGSARRPDAVWLSLANIVETHLSVRIEDLRRWKSETARLRKADPGLKLERALALAALKITGNEGARRGKPATHERLVGLVEEALATGKRPEVPGTDGRGGRMLISEGRLFSTYGKPGIQSLSEQDPSARWQEVDLVRHILRLDSPVRKFLWRIFGGDSREYERSEQLRSATWRWLYRHNDHTEIVGFGHGLYVMTNTGVYLYRGAKEKLREVFRKPYRMSDSLEDRIVGVLRGVMMAMGIFDPEMPYQSVDKVVNLNGVLYLMTNARNRPALYKKTWMGWRKIYTLPENTYFQGMFTSGGKIYIQPVVFTNLGDKAGLFEVDRNGRLLRFIPDSDEGAVNQPWADAHPKIPSDWREIIGGGAQFQP